MAPQKNSFKKKPTKPSSQPSAPPQPIPQRQPPAPPQRQFPSYSSSDEASLDKAPEIRSYLSSHKKLPQTPQRDLEEADGETDAALLDEGFDDEPEVLPRSNAAPHLVAASYSQKHRSSDSRVLPADTKVNSPCQPANQIAALRPITQGAALDNSKHHDENNRKRKIPVEEPAPTKKHGAKLDIGGEMSPSKSKVAGKNNGKVLFQQKRNRQDQLQPLNHVLFDYKLKHGNFPASSVLKQFKGFQIEFDSSQVQTKIRLLRKRYLKIPLSDIDLHELASKVWSDGNDIKQVKLEAVEFTNKTAISEDDSIANMIANFLVKFSCSDKCYIDMYSMSRSRFLSLSHTQKEKSKAIYKNMENCIMQLQIDYLAQLRKCQMDVALQIMKILIGDYL